MRSSSLVALVALLSLAGFAARRASVPPPGGAMPPNCPELLGIFGADGERLGCPDDPEAVDCACLGRPLVPGDRHRACESLGPLRGAVLRMHGLPIDVNRATSDDLRALTGVGPGLATRLVESRAAGPYCDAGDLERVSGIGPKRSAALAPGLTFGDARCGR